MNTVATHLAQAGSSMSSPTPSPGWYQSFTNSHPTAPVITFTNFAHAAPGIQQFSQQHHQTLQCPPAPAQPIGTSLDTDYDMDDAPVLIDLEEPQPNPQPAPAVLATRPKRVKTKAAPLKTSKWNPNKLHLPKPLAPTPIQPTPPLNITLSNDNTPQLGDDDVPFPESCDTALHDAFHAAVPCISCDLIAIHTFDCIVGAMQKENLIPSQSLTKDQLHTLGNSAQRALNKSWQPGDDLFRDWRAEERQRESMETKVRGMADILRGSDAVMNDPSLGTLARMGGDGNGDGDESGGEQKGDDVALLLMWGLSGVGLDKHEGDEGYASWFDDEDEEPVEMDCWIKPGRGL